jgi:DNA-binding transcriptional MerR regulator
MKINKEEYFGEANLEMLIDLHDAITKDHLSVRDTGIPYRVINHWDEKGLIRFRRSSAGGNRKFSFADFIWIRLIHELRSFGVKLPVIKKIAKDLYEPLPMKELFEGIMETPDLLKQIEDGPDKQDFIAFLKSGGQKEGDPSFFEFNYLQILIAEAIATRSPISLLIFKDGEWFPFNKEKENVYPEEMIRKKEFSSHISVSVTETIFSFILEDYLIEYVEWLHLFTRQEEKLLHHIKVGDYKKVLVLFKSKKQEPLEIKKSKKAQEQIMRILREKQYREFILVDSKNKEYRIRESQDEILTKALK